MDSTFVVSLMREALVMAFMASAPVLLVSLLVGVVIGFIQAITQVHEMTLVFVPRILLVGLVIALLGHWQLSMIVSFANRLFVNIPHLIR